MSLTPHWYKFLESTCNAEAVQHPPEAERPSCLQVGYEWVTRGLQMGYERVTSGLQVGYEWVMSGLQVGYKVVTSWV